MKPSNKIYHAYHSISTQRKILEIFTLIELFLIFLILAFVIFQFYVSPTYGYILFLQLPHAFAWVFVLAIAYKMTNVHWINATMVLYFIAMFLDLGATIWRSIYLSTTGPHKIEDFEFDKPTFDILGSWFVLVAVFVLILIDIGIWVTLTFLSASNQTILLYETGSLKDD